MRIASRVRGAFRSLFSKNLTAKIRRVFAPGHPALWAGDAREQAERFKSWNYVAVHAKSCQAMQASCDVLQEVESDGTDISEDDNKPRDPRLRSHRRTMKSHGLDDSQTDPVDQDHPLRQLLKRPNPRQSGSSFRYEIAQQIGLTGTAFIVKVRSGMTGLPIQLYVVPSALVSPVKPTNENPQGGWRIGQLAKNRLGENLDLETHGVVALSNRVVEPDDMIVIRWPHPIFKDAGFSPVEAGAMQTDTSDELDQSRYAKFRNQIDGSIGVSVDKETDLHQEDVDRLIEQMEARRAGSEHAGKILVAPPGGEVSMLGSSPRDMDYVKGFNQLRDSILSMHQTPSVAAGITDGGSYAAFFASLKQYTLLSVQPILDLIADELSEQLAVEFGDDLTIIMRAHSIDDPVVLEQRIRTDIEARSITKDEVRKLRDLPLWGPDNGGDEIAGTDPQPEAPESSQGNDDTTFDRDEDEDEDEPLDPDQSRTGLRAPTRTPPSNGKSHQGNGRGDMKTEDYNRVVREIVTSHWEGYP